MKIPLFISLVVVWPALEAAWQAAEKGVQVFVHEMRPNRPTEVHNTQNLAELVCSNSFRSDDASANAVGVLHAEMRMLNSIIMSEADIAAVPAGGALAVDRDIFSQGVEVIVWLPIPISP